MIDLNQVYADLCYPVVTAHRGFSGRYPENTLPAFRAAIDLRIGECGVGLIEFDVRGTRDGVPVVLHDPTLDRTSDLAGSPSDLTLAELREGNFTYWQGAYRGGRRLDAPAMPGVTIPTLEEVLALAKGQVGFNVQVYQTDPPLLREICCLYRAFDLYGDGYLTMSTYREAEQVREIDTEIVLCVLERQNSGGVESLDEAAAFGCAYVQPRHQVVSPAYFERARRLGLRANVFYANTPEDAQRLAEMGAHGVLADYPDVVLEALTRNT
jgi:glycerophosphoryl diester phosphodiesterase